MTPPSANRASLDDDPVLSRPDAGTDIYQGPQGLGPTLRALREAKRISLAEVSGRLKFSVRQFEALESEKWDLLPTGVSLRGFVKNYGRFLEADIDALITMLENQVGGSRTRPTAVVDAPSLASGGDVPMHPDATTHSWGWLVIIVLILLVAGFYAIERGWIPNSWLVFDWLKSLKK
ncbi:MAG TPA: helix-turn-helix transcriptional regulator [Burkholderiaceae bacterium]|nr:helix-turn-helix transcriptional regulator [Burkholderiaceae bacterium]